MILAAIVGGTGYTGVELIRLLSRHPQVEIRYLTSRSEAGRRVDDMFQSLRGVSNLVFSDLDIDKLAECDVVFFATPHGVAMKYAKQLLENNTKIIDLAADFRLQSITDFEKWYKQPHTCPDILNTAVYGLPEVNRKSIINASVIGNPGCYPTTAILGLKPIIDTQNRLSQSCIDERIIIDAKSGISGAGRQAKLNLNFAESVDNFSAYGVAGHRHQPEIEQGVQQILASKYTHHIRFLPHLVPMIRGMFTTIHLSLNEHGKAINWQQVYEETYQQEQFVDVLPAGIYPDTRNVRSSNQLRIAVYQNNSSAVLTILVVQDNLVKGAAGQAVQNMNIMFGFDEVAGLLNVPIAP